jgi:nitrite reductase/ring-hydroxylating ferredoxin subunit
MTNRNAETWWTIARSEEVSGKKLLSVDLDNEPVVLWRDTQGIVRALEDRCPHRRAPLSLGCIRDNGWIQCGYHGWSYDGETGRLKDIPNMKGEQRFPPLYKARNFAVVESGGLVRLSLDPTAAPPPPLADTMPLSGTAHVGLDHDQYLAALADDPGLLIAIRGVEFTPYLMSEMHLQENRLVMERSCLWSGLHWPAPFSSDFPITLLTSSDPITGETDLVLRDSDLRTLLTARLAPIRSARGVTAVRWRARLGNERRGIHARLLGLASLFSVRESIDAAALRVLRPSASRHGDDLRAAFREPPADIAATAA